jgi:hypothetical protein
MYEGLIYKEIIIIEVLGILTLTHFDFLGEFRCGHGSEVFIFEAICRDVCESGSGDLQR